MDNGTITALATAFVAVFTLVLAVSTILLWLITKHSFETTERAFVYMEGFGEELTTLADNPDLIGTEQIPAVYENHPEWYITRFAVQPKWGNGGTTPTKGMTIRVNVGETEETCPTKYGYGAEDAQTFFLPPKAVQGGQFIEIPEARAHVTRQLEHIANKPILLMWGRADYRDIFDRPHFVEWCYQIRFDAHKGEKLNVTFIQWGEYNRADYKR